MPGDELPLNDPEEIRDRLEKQVGLIMDAGFCGVEPSTVIDLSGEVPQVLRKGKGDLAIFGLEH